MVTAQIEIELIFQLTEQVGLMKKMFSLQHPYNHLKGTTIYIKSVLQKMFSRTYFASLLHAVLRAIKVGKKVLDEFKKMVNFWLMCLCGNEHK